MQLRRSRRVRCSVRFGRVLFILSSSGSPGAEAGKRTIVRQLTASFPACGRQSPAELSIRVRPLSPQVTLKRRRAINRVDLKSANFILRRSAKTSPVVNPGARQPEVIPRMHRRRVGVVLGGKRNVSDKSPILLITTPKVVSDQRYTVTSPFEQKLFCRKTLKFNYPSIK